MSAFDLDICFDRAEININSKPQKSLPLISITSYPSSWHPGTLYYFLHSCFTCSQGAIFHIWWSFYIIAGCSRVFEYGSWLCNDSVWVQGVDQCWMGMRWMLGGNEFLKAMVLHHEPSTAHPTLAWITPELSLRGRRERWIPPATTPWGLWYPQAPPCLFLFYTHIHECTTHSHR